MEIEFPSHFPHGLCRVQDIAIGDLAPHALRTSSNRLSCRSCRQPSTAKCAQQPPHDSDSHTKTRRMIRTGMAHLAATPPGGHIHGSSLRSRLKTVFSTRAARLGTLHELTKLGPVPIIADAVGYHPSTIERHAIGSASTYAEYIAAARELRQTS